LEKKIRIGAVSYLNTRPLLYGLKDHPLASRIALQEAYPSRVASMLLNDEIDIGLVPVAILPKLREYHLISDFCIGCDGPVASVALFADEQVDKLSDVFLDYQSRTSAMLLRLLFRDHWKLDIPLRDAGSEDFRNEIRGHTGGLVIGDRAFEQARYSPVMYDLGEVWKAHTGMPFVFATWVSNKPIDQDFIRDFNEVNAIGVGQLDRVAAAYPDVTFDLLGYYRDHLSYAFDAMKRAALQRFLSDIATL
jgi:chorismate dehydratase